jgi:Ca2+-binding EF-hand superfamily protein
MSRHHLRLALSLWLALSAVPALVNADGPSAPAPAANAFPYELSITGGDRPFRIRFQITVNGVPWRQHIAELQRRYREVAFVQLDADGDGKLSPAEAKRLPPPRAWASLPAGDEVYVAFNFRILDADGDGAASAAEFEEYLRAYGDVPVRLVTVPARRSIDDLFRALDANRDRALTAAEWSAAGKLLEKDRDGNKVLTAEELRGPASTAMPPEFVAAPAREGSAHQNVEFELKPVRDAPADAEISIDYQETDGAARRPRIGLRIADGATAHVARIERTSQSDLVLVIAGRRLVLRVPPAAVRSSAAQRQQLLNEYASVAEQSGAEVAAAASLPPLLKSVFAVADRNDDGRLEMSELEAFLEGMYSAQTAAESARLRIVKFNERPGLMSLVDFNLDGRLSLRELQALPQQLATIAGKSARVAPEDLPATVVLLVQRGPFGDSSEQSLLENAGPPWFFRADRNHDGDLDREEFLGTPADFDRLDANKDGWIDLDEAILGDAPAGAAAAGGAR